ncbi:MAG: hypothetical protein INQ03_21760 [Candidatus Heimdallarchaeota archaeon]|nr:hypothetical protein [Candidatus Heimdallarchaeota archaeon]
MALNITLEVGITSLCVFMIFFSAYIIFKQYRSSPDTALFAMAISWLAFGTWQVFNIIAYITLDQRPFLIKNIFLIIAAIGTNIFLGLMDAGEINKTHLASLSFLSAFAIASIEFPDPAAITTYPNGDVSISHTGFNRIITFILFFYIVLSYTYYAIKIIRNAPKSIQNDARKFLFGVLIFGIGGLVTFGSGLSGIIPGITDLVISFGMLFSSYGLVKTPQLLYVLPFKAIKLSVIESGSGANIFNYHWQEETEGISDDLFAATLLAISTFVNEGIGRGSINEIKLEGASLIISDPKDQRVFYIILATKPSYTLRLGLDKFARAFHARYKSHIEEKGTILVSAFDDAKDLIPDCFPYIPVRD